MVRMTDHLPNVETFPPAIDNTRMVCPKCRHRMRTHAWDATEPILICPQCGTRMIHADLLDEERGSEY